MRGRGGVVEDIYINDIRMKGIATDAIGFNMYYGGRAPEEESEGVEAVRKAVPVDEGTPRFRNIHIKNIVCTGAKRAIIVEGLPRCRLRGSTSIT